MDEIKNRKKKKKNCKLTTDLALTVGYEASTIRFRLNLNPFLEMENEKLKWIINQSEGNIEEG